MYILAIIHNIADMTIKNPKTDVMQDSAQLTIIVFLINFVVLIFFLFNTKLYIEVVIPIKFIHTMHIIKK